MYKAINYEFYDEIINTITLKQKVIIEYYDEGTKASIQGYIQDVFTLNKEEFCKIDNLLLKLDVISSLKVIKP